MQGNNNMRIAILFSHLHYQVLILDLETICILLCGVFHLDITWL